MPIFAISFDQDIMIILTTFLLTVDGLCILAAGTYSVAFRSGACSGCNSGDALACWSSGCSIVISEVEITDNNGNINVYKIYLECNFVI